MFCLACNKKMKEIKQDSDYKNWNRKYHKSCLKNSNIYLGLIEKCKSLGLSIPEEYKKRACIL